jgi:hypothetical protein
MFSSSGRFLYLHTRPPDAQPEARDSFGLTKRAAQIADAPALFCRHVRDALSERHP